MSLSPRRAKSVNAVLVKATTEITSTKSLCQHFNFAQIKPNLTMVEKSEEISVGLEETNFFLQNKKQVSWTIDSVQPVSCSNVI